MTHFHEHCGDLRYEFSTAPIEVLWSPGARTRVDLANDYEAVRELVHETLHEQIGMRRERVTTFGHIEEWTPADLDRYRKLGLPKLLEAGTKTICLANHFENNMNTWGVNSFCVRWITKSLSPPVRRSCALFAMMRELRVPSFRCGGIRRFRP